MAKYKVNNFSHFYLKKCIFIRVPCLWIREGCQNLKTS